MKAGRDDHVPPAAAPCPNAASPTAVPHTQEHLPARPRVLVTAGPTHEPIDRVRYIGNRSSGRMGLALADACAERHWPVTLLLGPIAMHDHTFESRSGTQVAVHRFQTAADLQRLLVQHWPDHDVLLMAAAVADYTVAQTAEEKIKRVRSGVEPLMLQLTPTPDLLASLQPMKRAGQVVVGFALEPSASLLSEAARKLRDKGLDAIVANPLETMDSPTISATLLLNDGRSIAAPGEMDKRDFARWLVDQVAAHLLRERAG